MEFCKQYNAATEPMRGTIIPVEITIYEDRTFTFILKTPPTTVLLREAAGLEKGTGPRARSGSGRSPTTSSPRSPRRRLPTSTRTTSRLPSGRSRAPRDRWASASASSAGAHGHRRKRTNQANKGKRYLDALKRLNRERLYSPGEAVDLVKSLATAKFDETIELAVRLGVDPRRAEQIVAGLADPARGDRSDGAGRRVRRRRGRAAGRGRREPT